MKSKIIALLFIILIQVASFAQEKIQTLGLNYYGKKINEKAFCSQFSFRSKEVAEKAVDEIVRRSGLKRNFYVMECPNTDNCFAAVQGQTRIIVYDGAFMKKANDLSKSDWGALSILAHEIGHHLQGHTIIEGGSDPTKELEADEFSGFVMYQMGASLKDAQAAIYKLTTDYDGGTHPPRSKRLAAIKKGYDNAQELYPTIKKSDGSLAKANENKLPDVELETKSVKVEEKQPEKNTNSEPKTNPENTSKKNPCFEGDCQNGYGKMVNPKTEEKYEGEWKNGKREGRGVEYYKNGEKKYLGAFKSSKYDGNGTFYFENGDKFVGKFKNGMMNDPKGYFIFNNNTRLVINIQNNIKNGKGMRIYPDGRREEVKYVDNVEVK